MKKYILLATAIMMGYQTVSFGMEDPHKNDEDANNEDWRNTINEEYGEDEGKKRIVDLFKKAKEKLDPTNNTFLLRTSWKFEKKIPWYRNDLWLICLAGSNDRIFLYNNDMLIKDQYTDGEILFYFGQRFARNILNLNGSDDIESSKTIDTHAATELKCTQDAIKLLKRNYVPHWQHKVTPALETRIARLQKLANKQKQIEK